MLHLLSSSCPSIKFKSFKNDSAVTDGYIILSHVWQDIEQPHEAILHLEREAAAADDPRLSIKVRECYRLARAYGYGWFWVDAPCIDNRNSTELSEAIRSMYSWYASASICFAHLPDVPSHDHIHHPDSAFRRSVYFRRGWTLQELIAPRRVIFLSSDWIVLGEKDQLPDLLEEITGIDQDVLTFRGRVADVSVARRLSWASQRETRYVEDQAYCLMGLFGIHMNIKYGEGDNAFLRLQQKILKKICDHTLFAWGAVTDMSLTHGLADVAGGCLPYSTTPLFAPSPVAFSRSRSMHPVDIETFMASTEALTDDTAGYTKQLPQFSLDHYGLKCRLPIVFRESIPVAALLACQDQDHSYIALALHPRGPRNAVYGVQSLGSAERLSAHPSGSGHASSASRLVRIPTTYIRLGAVPIGLSSSATAGLTVRFMTIHIAMRCDSLSLLTPLCLAMSETDFTERTED
ncbi:hypothetical protein VTO73DRAFT_5241 [Trametes versicolor]